MELVTGRGRDVIYSGESRSLPGSPSCVGTGWLGGGGILDDYLYVEYRRRP